MLGNFRTHLFEYFNMQPIIWRGVFISFRLRKVSLVIVLSSRNVGKHPSIAIQHRNISMYKMLLMEKKNYLNAQSLPTLEEIVIGLLTKRMEIGTVVQFGWYTHWLTGALGAVNFSSSLELFDIVCLSSASLS